MKKTCKICDRLVPSIEDEFCCAGCSAVFSIIEKLNLEGSERDERIKMLLEESFLEVMTLMFAQKILKIQKKKTLE